MIKIMRKLVPVLLFGMLTLLTGCHGAKDSAGFEMPVSFDSTRKLEITFWAKNDTNKTQTRIYEKAISDFESLYPNVTVNLRLYTDYGKIYNDVITNMATDTTPNVCITYPDHIATYLEGVNTIVPLDALMEDEAYGLGGSEVAFDAPKTEEIIPQFLEECTFLGHTYAMPYMRSTEACYINKTYVEKLGYTVPDELTWDFIWEVSEAATQKDADGIFAVNGQNVMIPFIYKSTDNMMIQMLKQLDAEYITEDGEIELFSDTTADILKEIGEHTKTGAFSTFKISGYPANFLNAGQCIFAIDSTAGSTWMGTHAPLLDISADKLVDFETVVRTVPQFDPEHPQMISQGPSVCVFNKADPQEVLASWLFVQYLLSNDVQIAYSETEGYAPVTSKAQNDEAYQAYLAAEGTDAKEHYDIKIKAVKMLLSHMEDTFVTPVFNGSASVRDAAGQVIENTVKSVRRKKTADDAFIRTLYSDVISLYRLDQLKGSNQAEGMRDLGPLPQTAKLLLGGLGVAWILILLILSVQIIRQKKKG